MSRKESLGEKLHQVGQDHVEAKALQDLHGVISGTVKHHTAIGELGIFPFATFAAIAEQAIFETAVVEQLTVKPYRLLTVDFVFDFFRPALRPPSGRSPCRADLKNKLSLASRQRDGYDPRPPRHSRCNSNSAYEEIGCEFLTLVFAPSIGVTPRRSISMVIVVNSGTALGTHLGIQVPSTRLFVSSVKCYARKFKP